MKPCYVDSLDQIPADLAESDSGMQYVYGDSIYTWVTPRNLHQVANGEWVQDGGYYRIQVMDDQTLTRLFYDANEW